MAEDNDQIKTWEDLKGVVGAWAFANFGSQRGLGVLCPLLGIVEEVGEFADAEAANDDGEMDDALGDICIFLMDYCSRGGVDLSSFPEYLSDGLDGSIYGYVNLSSAVGKLCHFRLKRCQMIRGMEDYNAFREAEKAAVFDIMVGCQCEYQQGHEESVHLFDLAKQVWTNVVAKRKWHTQPQVPITFESCVEDFKSVVAELNHGVS